MRTFQPGRTQVNLLATRKREHSRKPDEVYGIIEACSPGPFLEMFARYPHPRWSAWGDEAAPEIVPKGRVHMGHRPLRPTRTERGHLRVLGGPSRAHLALGPVSFPAQRARARSRDRVAGRTWSAIGPRCRQGSCTEAPSDIQGPQYGGDGGFGRAELTDSGGRASPRSTESQEPY
ncbi:MAG: MT-A70 family methyltransferase [Candidatus Limnocylindria bacterium]